MSADATPVGALVADPFTGIGIPLVAFVGDCPERRLYIVPSPLVIEPPANQLRDERAASPAPGPPVEFGDKFVIDGYVQSHVPMIAHKAHSVAATSLLSRRRTRHYRPAAEWPLRP